MKSLETNYSIEIDNINKNNWYHFLDKFHDASYYQTWDFGSVHWGENSVNRVILKKDNLIVSMAQIVIKKFPIIKGGIAYLNWGPIWKLDNSRDNNVKNLRNMLRALYIEYVQKRRYFLRILPKIIDLQEAEIVRRIFREEEFSFSPDPQQTVLIDLSSSIEDIKKNFSKRLRKNLRNAESQNIIFKEWLNANNSIDDEGIRDIKKIHDEMKARKKYLGGNQDEIHEIICKLPKSLNLRFIIAKVNGETLAALGWNSIGKIAFPLVGGTGNKALKFNISLLLHWKMIQYCKLNGYRYIDLLGINPKKNPGGYEFKKRLAGKNYIETEHYVGQFDACKNWISFAIFHTITNLKKIYQMLTFEIHRAINK